MGLVEFSCWCRKPSLLVPSKCRRFDVIQNLAQGRAHRDHSLAASRLWGPIRSDSPHQPGHQSMGVQTGVGLFAALGKLGARCVRRSVVLYDEQCLLLSSQSATSNGKAYRFARRPLELRLQQTEILGFTGRKFLVRRCDQLEQHPQFGHSPDKFAHWRDLFLSNP